MESSIGLAHKEALLRRSVIFHDLRPDLARLLAQTSHIRHLPKGTVLFQQGDDGDALFGIIEGLVRISVVGKEGKELTLGLMEPGDVFGEIALLDGLPRTADAEAAENSVLLVVGRAHFLQLLDDQPGLARHIIALLCERLRQNTDRLSENAFLDLRGRLARKLDALAVGHGQADQGGVRIELRLSQTDLAQMLGVTREAINKHLQVWARDGVLRLERGRITLLDRERLVADRRL